MDAEKKELIHSILDLFESDEFKKTFLNEINEEVDLPFLNEKKEGKVFKALYSVLMKTLRKQLK